ncbi:MAG: hypothetical protein JWN75_676 [Candidatus Saccharibacteria bacterium]|nr:hypothetical protein [Candidatus Saccharibacteria bacterium]
MTKILAIANCRVSSDEQLLNGSLGRQKTSVEQAALKLNAELIKVWSGSTSSKKGVNIKRTDLDEMLDLCKKQTRIKYVIIDELDRFMRSMLEIGYFLVLFNKLGVKVVFASQPDLKTDTAADTLMLMLEAFKAEGSNEERQRKSISGQTTALLEGRYTYCPKPGYMKGTMRGIHILHPERGPALQKILKRLACNLVSPTNALIELNKSPFTKNHALYKMDKFRKIVTDPYYAGVVVIDKQVKGRNEHGLHEAIITLKEHYHLVEIMYNKPKYQIGPKRNGNPMFPLSNLVEDDTCLECKDKGRLVGVPHNNGKSAKIYKKYRCRTCRYSWELEDMHHKIANFFAKYEMSEDTQEKIVKALGIVWQKDTEQKTQNIATARKAIFELRSVIKQHVESATDPTNEPIRDELFAIIKEKKARIVELEAELERLSNTEEQDQKEFMEFALSFIEETGRHFLEPYVTKENRLRCKQMLFPGGIMVKDKEKVYTPEVSVFYRLGAKKKDTEVSNNSHLVRVKRL